MKKMALTLVLALGVGACYHATIETGLPAGPDKIEKKWAHSFLGGLVPPETIETMEKCPNGVARVETRHSFLNQVANAITMGLYTPMEIIVTCAASNRSREELDLVQNEEELREAVKGGEPFLLPLN